MSVQVAPVTSRVPAVVTRAVTVGAAPWAQSNRIRLDQSQREESGASDRCREAELA